MLDDKYVHAALRHLIRIYGILNENIFTKITFSKEYYLIHNCLLSENSIKNSPSPCINKSSTDIDDPVFCFCINHFLHLDLDNQHMHKLSSTKKINFLKDTLLHFLMFNFFMKTWWTFITSREIVLGKLGSFQDNFTGETCLTHL